MGFYSPRFCVYTYKNKEITVCLPTNKTYFSCFYFIFLVFVGFCLDFCVVFLYNKGN